MKQDEFRHRFLLVSWWSVMHRHFDDGWFCCVEVQLSQGETPSRPIVFGFVVCLREVVLCLEAVHYRMSFSGFGLIALQNKFEHASAPRAPCCPLGVIICLSRVIPFSSLSVLS